MLAASPATLRTHLLHSGGLQRLLRLQSPLILLKLEQLLLLKVVLRHAGHLLQPQLGMSTKSPDHGMRMPRRVGLKVDWCFKSFIPTETARKLTRLSEVLACMFPLFACRM